MPRLGFDDQGTLQADHKTKVIYEQVADIFDDIEQQLARLRQMFATMHDPPEEHDGTT